MNSQHILLLFGRKDTRVDLKAAVIDRLELKVELTSKFVSHLKFLEPLLIKDVKIFKLAMLFRLRRINLN